MGIHHMTMHANISRLTKSALEDRSYAQILQLLFQSERRPEFFQPPDNSLNTRNDKPLVKENTSRTKRCFKAPHNYLSRLVNENKTNTVK